MCHALSVTYVACTSPLFCNDKFIATLLLSLTVLLSLLLCIMHCCYVSCIATVTTIGEWEDGKMHGEGCYTSATGSCYHGQYRKSKRHGTGSMKFGDGRYLRYYRY
jgi:MORN repeat